MKFIILRTSGLAPDVAGAVWDESVDCDYLGMGAWTIELEGIADLLRIRDEAGKDVLIRSWRLDNGLEMLEIVDDYRE